MTEEVAASNESVPAGAEAAPQTPLAKAQQPGAGLTPHQQFLNMLPEDLREDPSFIDFKGESVDEIIGKIGKSYINTKKLVGADKNAILKIPSSEEDVDGWNSIYSKLGRPEAADKYGLDEIVEGNDFINKEQLGQIAEIAFKHGVSEKALKEIVGAYVEQTKGQGAAYEEQLNTMLTEYDTTLDKEWGQAKNQKLAKIQNTINKFATDDFKKIVLENPVIFEHPDVSKFFDALLASQAEDTGADGGSTAAEGALTPAEAKAELNRMDGDKQTRSILMDPNDPRREELLTRRTKLFKYAYGSSS